MMYSLQSKKVKLVMVITVILSLILGACQPAPTQAPAPEPAKTEEVAEKPTEKAAASKVAVLLPGVIYDKSWSQLGYEGAKDSADKLGIELAYSENVTQAEQTEVFRNYAQQGYNIIIGHGGQFYDAANTVGAEFPETQFIVTNAMEAHDNVSAMTHDYGQIGYMAGAIACRMTKTNKVGVVVGQRIPLVDPAWETMPLGAKSCGKDVEVVFSVTGDFADANKAREAALALIADGVDVLWGLTNEAIAGMFSAAEDRGVYAMGLYTDQSAESKSIIASLITNPDGLTREAAGGNVEPGVVNFVTFATSPGGLDVAMTDLIPADVQAELKQVQKDLAEGKIDLP